MRKTVVLIFVVYLFFGCKRKEEGLRYFKMMTIYEAANTTKFNKGFSLGIYFNYNANSDEVLVRAWVPRPGIDSFETHLGSFSGTMNGDTIAMFAHALKRFRNGSYPYKGEYLYCGPVFYTELIDESGIHSHIISVYQNDTLAMFLDTFFRKVLGKENWTGKAVSNSIINDSVEMVRILKSSGKYYDMPEPFIPPSCDSTVNMALLFGKWRFLADRYTGVYSTVTIDSSVILIDKVYKDSTVRKYRGRLVSVDPKGSYKVSWENDLTKLEVLVLTNECLQYRVEGNPNVVKLYRVH